jgi:hypothetical protein
MSATTAFDQFQMTPLVNRSRDLVIPVLKKVHKLTGDR